MSFVVGRRIPFVLGVALFLAGSVLCGLSQSPAALLIGRAVQGLGAGGPVPITALILTDLFDMRRRAKYVSFLNIAWALGTITGPLIGGLVVDRDSVGWVSKDPCSISYRPVTDAECFAEMGILDQSPIFCSEPGWRRRHAWIRWGTATRPDLPIPS